MERVALDLLEPDMNETPYRNMRRRIYERTQELMGCTREHLAEVFGCSKAAISNTMNGNASRQNDTAVMRRRIFRRYKEMVGCQECGYNAHFAALDFNHINPKDKLHHPSALISSTVTGELLWAELEKCEVLCSNCHRIHSHETREENKNVS